MATSMTEREPTRTVARREIERRILEGAFLPGNQLKITDVSHDTGIGMTPLREAMIEVVREGLLENPAGRGFFVPSLTVEESQELYPLIWTLEGLAVRLTTEFPKRQLAQLRSVNKRFSRVRDDPAGALELDSEWHWTLVEGCGNALLLETLARIKLRAARYQFAFQRSAGHWPISVKHHERIVRALDADDRDKAIGVLEANWAPGPVFIGEWLLRDEQRRTRTGARAVR